MKIKIKFASENKIHSSSYKLIEQVYDIRGTLLTNYSSLYDFEDLLDTIPGHKMISFSKIPLRERKRYKNEPDFVQLDRFWVWYPPLTKEEEKDLAEAYRRTIIKKLEKIYNISFKNYPNDKLYVWEVAKFILKKLSIQ